MTNRGTLKAALRETPLATIVVDGIPYFYAQTEHEGYLATTCGHIISTKGAQPLLLKPRTLPNGYKQVTIGGREHYVHRLVGSTYLEAGGVGRDGTARAQINHFNSVTGDNHVANLEWVTPKENASHAAMMRNLRKTQAPRAKAQEEADED